MSRNTRKPDVTKTVGGRGGCFTLSFSESNEAGIIFLNMKGIPNNRYCLPNSE